MRIKKLNYIYNTSGLFMIHVFIPSGSIYENIGHNKNAKISGISHFLEHILFKHTENYSGSEILSAFTEIGGYYNASTDKDETIFYVKTLSESYQIAVDLLYDIVAKPLFVQSEIDTELKVVLEELSQTQDDLQDLVYETSNRTLLKDNNIYLPSVIGNKKHLKSITIDDVKKYYKERFGNVMVLVNCDQSQKGKVHRYVEGKFGKNNYLSFYEPKFESLADRFDSKVKIYSRSSYQYSTTMLFKSFQYNEVKKNIVLSFLRFCLTDAGLYSILYYELREKRGLIYNVKMSIERYRYIGLVRIHFATSNKNLLSILHVVKDVLVTLATKGLKSTDLKYFKSSYLSSIGYKFANEEYRTSWHGDNLFYGCKLSEEDFMSTVKAITNRDIINVAQEIFNFQNVGIFSLGAYDDASLLKRQIKKQITS